VIWFAVTLSTRSGHGEGKGRWLLSSWKKHEPCFPLPWALIGMVEDMKKKKKLKHKRKRVVPVGTAAQRREKAIDINATKREKR